MSEPETCPRCGRKVPDESGWKEQHAEHCSPDPSAIAARARAEAFEEAARIAEARCADFVERLAALLETGGNSVEMQARASESARIAAEIRRRAKP